MNSRSPDPKRVSTPVVERLKRAIRMQNRRATRPTKAFSKKFQNQVHALALDFAFCNFTRVQRTLRMSLAVAAGIIETLRMMEDIVVSWTCVGRTRQRRAVKEDG